MANVGPLQILVVLVIALVIFGPKRIPELGRSLGEGFRGFKDSLAGEEAGSESAKPVRLAPSSEAPVGNDATARSRNESAP